VGNTNGETGEGDMGIADHERIAFFYAANGCVECPYRRSCFNLYAERWEMRCDALVLNEIAPIINEYNTEWWWDHGAPEPNPIIAGLIMMATSGHLLDIAVLAALLFLAFTLGAAAQSVFF
jgi:hypothetical protein